MPAKTYTTNMQPSTWYHVVFEWTTNGCWGWLNGQAAFTGAHNSQMYLNFTNVALGNGYASVANRYWKGKLDEARIYNRLLTPSEISVLSYSCIAIPKNIAKFASA